MQIQPSRIGIGHHSLKALVGYCILGALFFSPLLSHLTTHILADDSFIRPGQSDAFNSLWTYWWIQKAVFTGSDLFHCTWVLPPTGADLFFHSTSILPTILSAPIAKLLGVVAGYNAMILLLIVFSAWAYYLFLSETLHVSRFSAFVIGVLFGFCPYFLFKAHAHINLVGACFWGGALAVILHSYLHDKFNFYFSITFALLFWSTFWTSFVEFFMLAVILAIVVIVLEIKIFHAQSASIRKRLLFYLPAGIGAVPAMLLLLNRTADEVSVSLFYDKLRLSQLFIYPKLSFLAQWGSAKMPENWGIYLPTVVVALGVLGVIALYKERLKQLIVWLILIVLTAISTLNVEGVPALILRSLPLGSGFRVFSRFFPFLLFFMLILSAYGFDFIMKRTSAVLRIGILALLFVWMAAEYVPVNMNVSAVKEFQISLAVKEKIDPHAYVWVIPDGDYLSIHDTYQIALNMHCVKLSYLARESKAASSLRTSQYPILYGSQSADTLGSRQKELGELNVKYLLFENKDRMADFPLAGDIIAEDTRQVFVAISAK